MFRPRRKERKENGKPTAKEQDNLEEIKRIGFECENFQSDQIIQQHVRNDQFGAYQDYENSKKPP